jgi:prolipoprotein diacylglyceryltransferase
MFIIQAININLINIEMVEMHMHEIFYLFGILIALLTLLKAHNKRTKNIIY